MWQRQSKKALQLAMAGHSGAWLLPLVARYDYRHQCPALTAESLKYVCLVFDAQLSFYRHSAGMYFDCVS